MAESGDKSKGASKVSVSNRVTKFRLPDRTPRPADETYFDHVLSAVERPVSVPSPEVVAGGSIEAILPPEVNTLDKLTSVQTAIRDEQLILDSIAPKLRASKVKLNTPPREQNDYQAASSSSISKPLSPSPQPVTSLRERADRRGSSQSEASAISLPLAVEATPFEDFKRKWSQFLTGTLINLCEEIYSNTVAIGRLEYETTASSLCSAVKKSRRHTFLLLSQLEQMGFVSRTEVKDNNRLLGIKITFSPNPLPR